MFKYFGSKYKLARHYPTPTRDVIVEPFGGSAAYAVHHRKLAREVLVYERDSAVVALWHRLLAMDADEIMALSDPVAGEWCADILVAFAAGRTTRDTPSKFLVSPRMEQRFRPMISRIASVVDDCRHFKVVCASYVETPPVDATWFIDPPYQYRGGRWDRSRGGRYRYANDQINYPALAEWTQARAGQVIACEQSGADWLPWNGAVLARDNTHSAYSEIWWHRDQARLDLST